MLITRYLPNYCNITLKYMYIRCQKLLRTDSLVTVLPLELILTLSNILLVVIPQENLFRLFHNTNIINKIHVCREKSIPMIALWCPSFGNHG